MYKRQGYYLGLTQFELGMVALGACLGHIFPIFFQFKGGKGVATAFGAIAPISWGVAGSTLGTWLLVFLISRYSSLSAVITALLVPFYVWWLKPEFTFPVALVLSLIHISRRVDVSAKVGTVERWIINSSLPVGFTIQGAKFVIESQDDVNVDLSELAWKDTVWVKKKVQILVKFEQPSSNTHPFLFGSSNLMLADMGCLGIMTVSYTHLNYLRLIKKP